MFICVLIWMKCLSKVFINVLCLLLVKNGYLKVRLSGGKRFLIFIVVMLMRNFIVFYWFYLVYGF